MQQAKRVNAQVHINSVVNKMQNNVDAKNKCGKKLCEFVFIMRSLTMFTWKIKKNYYFQAFMAIPIRPFRLTTS